jgi:exosortase
LTQINPTSSLAASPTSSFNDRGPLRPASQHYLGLSLEAWVQIAILTPLFIAVYWLVLRWLWDKTNPIYGEANWGHAICIPLVGLYYLYINRDDLLQQPVEPLVGGRIANPWRLYPALAMIAMGGIVWAIGTFSAVAISLVALSGMLLGGFGLLVLLLDWGLACLFGGLALFAFGIHPGKNQFVQGIGMIVTLFGVVLTLTGWRIMKYAWFPIVYLICGIPWPALVYSYIASPLQTFAARVAVKTLQFTGVQAYRTGTKINMGGITEELRTLNVAEACAGLRSLMTFITVGVAVAFLSARPLWQKLIITASSVPIAIFCNVVRVAGQGLLDHYVSRQLSESFAHQFVGLVMLVPAFFMILAVGWILDQIFVEEADDSEGRSRTIDPASGLVVEIPRKGRVAALPARKPPVAPMAAPAVAKAPVAPAPAPAVAKPPVSAPPRPAVAPAVVPPRPATAVTPPRPGIIPPRPNLTPPRPGIVPPRPVNRPPQQPPKEGA